MYKLLTRTRSVCPSLQASLKSSRNVYDDYLSRNVSVNVPDLTPAIKLYEEKMPAVPGVRVLHVAPTDAVGFHVCFRNCGDSHVQS
jgi:hypothetical protein